MSLLDKFLYRFRKHPLVRIVSTAGIIALAVYVFFFLSTARRQAPVLTGIHPAVGEPGEIITLTGKNFGSSKESDSYVEIAGCRLTTSSYLVWTDTSIKAVLPYNVEDGLVYVTTKNGRSEAEIFANRQTIPVPVSRIPATAIPFIESVQKKAAQIGSLITITGTDFGSLRGNSRVLFTSAYNAPDRETLLIPCSEFDSDYVFWSDTRLQVRVPDGAATGQVFVETDYGKSSGFDFTVSSSAGSKTYADMHTYSVKVAADISDAQAETNSLLTLFIPLPQITSAQKAVTIVNSNPEPSIPRYMNTLVHQVSLHEAIGKKLNFSHTFVLTVYAVHSQIQASAVKSVSEETKKMYGAYLKSNAVTPSDNKAVRELAASIIKNEKNPFVQAKLLYTWLIKNMRVSQNTQSGDTNVLRSLSSKKADAYDMAVLYTALLRAAGIPSLTNGGILVDSDMQSRNHWWCEFYIDEVGWIPADPALGAGLAYKAFQKPESAADFYFGNSDAQHITFSRGWNNIKPAHVTGKKVYRPKSYALQSIWEETTAGSVKYSSYWQDAAVTGIY
ncbi:transglutaminase domain-containing protein [Treponema maltophilum]|uniref:transglutaminase domain-containing protein n=1 Tax=Treponema maltophilum TaxID=51160 RepID=UPI003D8B7AB8